MKIEIKNPCTQNWESMPLKDGGRHCAQCQHTIHDFSSLSDAAVLHFFNSHPKTTCGRFSNDQLNRELYLPLPIAKPQSFRLSFRNTFVPLFSLLLFKSEMVNARNNVSSLRSLQLHPSAPDTSDDKQLVISCRVFDDKGKLLKGAAISFNGNGMGETEADGNLSFALPDSIAQFNHLTFQFDGFVTAVRSYHAAMGSTSYEIRMELPPRGQVTMGIIAPVYISLPAFEFKPGVVSLNKEQKALLDTVAFELNSHPFIAITIEGYAEKSGKSAGIAQKRTDIIKRYLVKSQGIAEDRVQTNVELGIGANNTIDIKSNY
jgi:hypothetical protein